LAAAAIGTLQIGVAVSLATLVFVGPLSAGAGRGAAGFILGTSISLLIVGTQSRVRSVISGSQDTAAIVAAAVAASLALEVAPEQSVSTVLVMLALGAVFTGVAMWLMGRYGLGSIVRFLPYPVVSGFMAGTGWLLFRGGLEVMHGQPIELGDFFDLFSWEDGQFLVVGLALGLFMLFCVARKISGVMISAAILATAIGFHLIARSVTTLEVLERDGWLVGPFPEGAGWKPVGPTDFLDADWGALASNGGGILILVIVSILGLMLNLGGLEEVLESEIDVDHEMRIAGVSNLPIAFGGGLISYHLIGDTTLAAKLGVRGKATALTIAAVGFALFLFGYDVIALMPRAAAGGVLVGIGLTVLYTWLQGSLRRMNKTDRSVSALILFIIATAGILTGVGVGLLIATLFFVFRYSRVDPIRHLVAAAGRSNVDRPAHQRRMLEAARDQLIAVHVQGYLFFGSITRLRRSIAGHSGEGQQPPRYLLFHFGRVTGIDFTAASGIGALAASLEAQGTTCIWSALTPAVADELSNAGVDLSTAHPDYDHAVAWAEQRLINAAELRESQRELPDAPPDDDHPAAFDGFDHLESIELASGEELIAAGSTRRELYIVDSGRLNAVTQLDDGRPARLRQISEGSIIGEMSFCTGAPRSAQVVADGPARVRVFSRERFDHLLRTDPAAALEVQDFLMRRLAHRLSDTSSLVRDLMQ